LHCNMAAARSRARFDRQALAHARLAAGAKEV
jgi:hypothetical protein